MVTLKIKLTGLMKRIEWNEIVSPGYGKEHEGNAEKRGNGCFY